MIICNRCHANEVSDPRLLCCSCRDTIKVICKKEGISKARRKAIESGRSAGLRELAHLIKEGEVEKKGCEVCLSLHGKESKVVYAWLDDVMKVREVKWLCASHYMAKKKLEKARRGEKLDLPVVHVTKTMLAKRDKHKRRMEKEQRERNKKSAIRRNKERYQKKLNKHKGNQDGL